MGENVICTFLVVGDMHLKTNNVKETKILMDGVFENINEYQPNVIVFLGDTLDSFERIQMSLLTTAMKFFKECASTVYSNNFSPEVYVIIGNHDRKHNQVFLTDNHPFYGLKGMMKNLNIVDQPKDLYVGGKRIVFCPYVPEDRFIEALGKLKKPIKDKSIDILFAHQDFDKIKTGKEIKLIISGHIHESKKDGKVFYPGTPYQHNFGESPDKGIYIFELIDNGSLNKCKLSLNIPIKKTIEVTEEELEDLDTSKLKNTRVILKGSVINKKTIEELKEKGNKLVVIKDVYKSDIKNFDDIMQDMMKDHPKLQQIFKTL